MAELFINPLVPQPIVVSTLTMTTGAGASKVMTSDADGLGSWQTPTTGGNVAVANADPHIAITNNATNSNGATLAFVARGGVGDVELFQASTGDFSIENHAAAGPISITSGAAGDVTITSVAGNTKLLGARILANGIDVVVSDEVKVTQLTSVTTGVSALGYSVAITMFSPSVVAAGSIVRFTLTNARIIAGSIVLANIIGYTGGGGLPSCYVSTTSVGSCVITVNNSDAAADTGGIIKIGLLIL